jgi:hypothetical protein
MRKDRFDLIHDLIIRLCPDIKTLNPGDYRKSTSPGFMDLNLDVLGKTDKEMRIALSHYYRHPSGDMICDPDMEIRIYLIEGWEKAEALAYQDSMRYDLVYPAPGMVNPRIKKDVNSFLEQWLLNCIAQNHDLSEKEKNPEIFLKSEDM